MMVSAEHKVARAPQMTCEDLKYSVRICCLSIVCYQLVFTHTFVLFYFSLLPTQTNLERLELSCKAALEIIEERLPSKIRSFLLVAQKPEMT